MSAWLNRWLGWVCLLSPLLLLLEGCSGQEVPRALSPKQALQSFRLPDVLRIELFASEPYVVYPVKIAFDEAGRAYVAEMRDYPEDPHPGQPHCSRYRLLEV